MFLFTEKNMPNYLGFYKGLTGCYIVFMNYIAALTFKRKLLSLSDWQHEVENEAFKDQNSYLENYPYHPFYQILSPKIH